MTTTTSSDGGDCDASAPSSSTAQLAFDTPHLGLDSSQIGGSAPAPAHPPQIGGSTASSNGANLAAAPAAHKPRSRAVSDLCLADSDADLRLPKSHRTHDDSPYSPASFHHHQQQQQHQQQQLMLHYGIGSHSLAHLHPKFYPFSAASPPLELDSTTSSSGGGRYGSFIPTHASAAAAAAQYNSLLSYGTAGLSRGFFTAEQWSEFTRQTYIFKHFTAGVAPPAALLLPIVNSLISMGMINAASSLFLGSATNAGGFNMGLRGGMDPEPGRCRRTDGKKWRCSREVMPDQKYCERHMHRGRHRARAKATSGSAATSGGDAAPSTTSGGASVSSPSHTYPYSIQLPLPPSCTRSDDGSLFSHPSGGLQIGDVHQISSATAQTPPNLADLLKSHSCGGDKSHTTELQRIMQQQQQTEHSHVLPLSCFNGSSSRGGACSGGWSPAAVANLVARQVDQGIWPTTTTTVQWLAEESNKRRSTGGLDGAMAADLSMRLQSPLSLAMAKVEDEEEETVAARMGGRAAVCWWESGANFGGPLAEALQTSTATNSNGGGDGDGGAGYLSFVEDGWEERNHNNATNNGGSSAKDSGSPSLASPTGVLQISGKGNFGAYSDSSSSASSPRSGLKLDSVTQHHCENLC